MTRQSVNTTAIITALLGIAPELEIALGAEWPRVRDLLTGITAKTDDADVDSLRRELDDLLAELLETPVAGEVRRVLIQTNDDPVSSRGFAPGAGPARGQESISADRSLSRLDPDGIVFVPVFYGTNRAWRDGEAAECYTAERSELAFGVVHVSVPVNHKLGELEAPRWWRFDWKENPRRHFALLRVSRLNEAEFVGHAKETVAALELPEALLFIHGYNVLFSSAAKRAAQLAVDLKFDGPVLLYSWPSLGDPRLYTADEATIEFCRPHLEQFLRIALTKVGARSLHAIAHSMGNRPLAAALERLKPEELSAGPGVLRQVVFAAPDVDRDVFRQLSVGFRGRAQRCTLYASSNDLALKLSKTLHRYPRAGDAGPSLLTTDGIDTVDASEVDTSIFGLGHSYFAEKRSILSDVYHLLRDGRPPDRRFDLMAMQDAQGRYWKYRR